MLLISTPIIMAILALIIAIHILAAVLKETASRILNFVNIFLHIAMVPLLIYYKFTVEESVLLYMISVTVYTFSFVIKFKTEQKNMKEENKSSDDEVREDNAL